MKPAGCCRSGLSIAATFKIKAIQAAAGRSHRQHLHGQRFVLQAAASIGRKPDTPTPPGVNWDLFRGPAPCGPSTELRFKYNWHWFWDTGNGDIGNQGVHELGVARWALGDPEWPKTAHAQGGKYAYDDDQETPNTLLAGFDFGGRELVFEVRGLLTNAEGSAVQRKPGPPAQGAVAPPGSTGPVTRLHDPERRLTL